MTKFFTLAVAPFPAPRMTQRSKFVDERAKKYLRWKDDVAWLCRLAQFELPESQLSISFRFATTHKDRWGQPHTGKPDLDNLVKGLFDALKKDDHRVTQFSCDKKWAETSEIHIEWLDA